MRAHPNDWKWCFAASVEAHRDSALATTDTVLSSVCGCSNEDCSHSYDTQHTAHHPLQSAVPSSHAPLPNVASPSGLLPVQRSSALALQKKHCLHSWHVHSHSCSKKWLLPCSFCSLWRTSSSSLLHLSLRLWHSTITCTKFVCTINAKIFILHHVYYSFS